MRIKELTRLSSTPIPKALMGGLVFILGILIYGLILLHLDREAFLVWIREDGLVEWLTFVELLIMAIYSGIVSGVLGRSEQGRASKRVWLFLGLVFFFRGHGGDLLGAEGLGNREPGVVSGAQQAG